MPRSLESNFSWLRLPVAIVAFGTACAGMGWLLAYHGHPHAPRNVVLVLIDTLRADHLSAYGYHRPTSPFFDSLAERGVLFENTVSAAPATFPSVNTLLTSQPPAEFIRNNAKDLSIPESMTTLAEVMRAAGFRTAAVSASPIVRKTPSRYTSRGGFAQGIEEFDESCNRRGRVQPNTTRCVTDRALGLVNKLAGERFFLYVHYLDPHGPYKPAKTHRQFVKRRIQRPFVRDGKLKPILDWLYDGGPDLKVTDAEIQHLRDLYDGEILGVDGALKRLLHDFRDRDLVDDTLFVVLSDHGEAFMDHGHMAHGRNMFQPVLHVPLLFYWPKGLEPARRSDLACTRDVMPTILALVGLSAPDSALGAPVLGPSADRSTTPQVCQSVGRINWKLKQSGLISLRMGSDKIIYYASKGVYEAYDLAEDPGETRDLVAEDDRANAHRIATLKEALQLSLDAAMDDAGGRGSRDARDSEITLDADAEAALRALGYIQ